MRRHSDRSGANEIRVLYENLELHNWTTARVDKLKKYRFVIPAFCILCALISLTAPLPLAARATLALCALLAANAGHHGVDVRHEGLCHARARR